MIYTYRYKTPCQFDDLKLSSDGEYLTEVSFIRRNEIIRNSDER